MELLYEISYLLNPTLTEEDARNFLAAAEAKIGEIGGTIKESMKPSRVELPYEIQKQKNAWREDLVFGIEQDAKSAEAIRTFLNADQSVLRCLFSKIDKKSLLAIRQAKEGTLRMKPITYAPQPSAEKPAPDTQMRPAPEQKEEKREVKMEEIEQKLEELLK